MAWQHARSCCEKITKARATLAPQLGSTKTRTQTREKYFVYCTPGNCLTRIMTRNQPLLAGGLRRAHRLLHMLTRCWCETVSLMQMDFGRNARNVRDNPRDERSMNHRRLGLHAGRAAPTARCGIVCVTTCFNPSLISLCQECAEMTQLKVRLKSM